MDMNEVSSLTVQDRDCVSLPSVDALKLIAELAQAVSSASSDEVPAVIDRILAAAREVLGLEEGTVSILDDLAGDVSALEGTKAGWRLSHRKSYEESYPPLTPPLPAGAVRPPGVFLAPSGSPVVAPLVTGSRQVGALLVTSPGRPLALDSTGEASLAALAAIAAVAIERRQQQSPRPWLKPLRAVSSTLAATKLAQVSADLDILLQNVADDALELSGADFVVLYEFFQERRDVRLPPTVSGSMRSSSILRSRSVVSEHRQSAVFRLVDRGQPFYALEGVRDWLAAGLVNPEAATDGHSFFIREAVVSSAGLPLRNEDETIGALFVNFRQPQKFTRQMRDDLELFASQAALALGNTRFFLRSVRYSENLVEVGRIGRELGAAIESDIGEIGALLDQQLSRILATPNFFLALYELEEQGEGEPVERYSVPYIRDQHDRPDDLAGRLHHGLTALVCRSRTPLLLDRRQQEQLILEGKAQMVGHPSAIWLGTPLVSRDKVIGALVIQDYADETAFEDEHLQLLSAIAAEASIAIDSHLLLRDVKLQLKELEAQQDISRAFATPGVESSQLLSSILDHLCRIADADHSLLLLLDRSRDPRLKVVASSSDAAQYVGQQVRLGEGVAGTVTETGKPLIINNYPRWHRRSLIFAPPPLASCAVPLRSLDKVIGALCLSSHRTARSFTTREIRILERFAAPTAVAIQKARAAFFRQVIIQGGPNAIVAVDHEGKITEINEEAARLFKWPVSHLDGHSVTELYWNGVEDARRIQALLRESSGKIRETEIFGKSSTGEKLPLAIAATILRDDTGEIGSVGILDDLRLQSLRGRTQLLVDTLRKLSDAEDLAEISEQIVLSAITLLFADSGCLFLADGGNFQVQYRHGHDDSFFSIPLPESALQVLKRWAAEDPRGTRFLPEDLPRPGLQLLPDARSAVLVPIRTEAVILGFLLIESREAGHFAGEQKLLEVLASQAAVSINRVQLLDYRQNVQQSLQVSANAIAVGQITATFLHEAKNSLYALGLTLQDLQEAIKSEARLANKAKLLTSLVAMREETSRFGDLARRLQRFSRNRLDPEAKELFINDLVTSTLHAVGSTLRAKKLKEVLRLDPALGAPGPRGGHGCPVSVDEYQIQQVLMNLILNAVYASPKRGRIVVETHRQDRHVEILVADQGHGISDDVRRRLFKPFFTTKPDGVGLGLYLSRILVEKNNGRLEITSSAPGRGTTFCIRLPRIA
jgi:PAS domain S-box-containing protein